jgi:hypothetical protein
MIKAEQPSVHGASKAAEITPLESRKFQYLVARNNVQRAMPEDAELEVFAAHLPLDSDGALRLGVDVRSPEISRVPAWIAVDRTDTSISFMLALEDAQLMKPPFDSDDTHGLRPADSQYRDERFMAFEVIAPQDGAFLLRGHLPNGEIVVFPPDSDENDGSSAIGKLVAICGVVVIKAAEKGRRIS